LPEVLCDSKVRGGAYQLKKRQRISFSSDRCGESCPRVSSKGLCLLTAWSDPNGVHPKNQELSGEFSARGRKKRHCLLQEKKLRVFLCVYVFVSMSVCVCVCVYVCVSVCVSECVFPKISKSLSMLKSHIPSRVYCCQWATLATMQFFPFPFALGDG
jgi:hypothetical protein